LLPDAAPNEFQGGVNARDALTTQNVNQDETVMVPVPFRQGAPGVIDLARLNASLMATPGTNMGTAVDGAEFALQMLRFPYRQVFGDPNVVAPPPPITDVFKPTVALAQLRISFEEVLQP
jgi:hypothetical protein